MPRKREILCYIGCSVKKLFHFVPTVLITAIAPSWILCDFEKEIRLAFPNPQLELWNLFCIFLRVCLWFDVPVEGVAQFSLEI